MGVWVRPEASDGVVISLGGASDGLRLYLKEGVPSFALRRFGALTTVQGATAVPDGQWTHLAATLTADHTLRLYANGRLVAEDAPGGLLGAMPFEGFMIGADHHTTVGDYESNLRWKGLMKDVRVYWGSIDQQALRAWMNEFRP